MGHYLAEMEDDGVPRAFKAGTSTAPPRSEKYSIIKCVCTKKEIERRFGITLTWDQVDAYLDAMEERRPRMAALQADFNGKAREVYRDALTAILGKDPAPSLSRVNGRGE